MVGNGDAKVTDCWSLCRDWYKEELRIELIDWVRPKSSEDFIKNPMFENCFEKTGFRELLPTEHLRYGDLLLMSIGKSRIKSYWCLLRTANSFTSFTE